MCDPISIGLMLGTKAASAWLQNRAAGEVDEARDRAIRGAEADIEAYRQTARQDYDRSFQASTPEAMQERAATQAADRGASYQAVVADPQNIVQDTASDAARRAIAMALARSSDFSRQQAALRGGAEAYGAAAADRDIIQRRAAGGIGQQANFAKGRSRQAEAELIAAQDAGRKYANLAGLVDAVGTVAGAGYDMFGAAPSIKTVTKDIYGKSGPFAGKVNPAIDIYTRGM